MPSTLERLTRALAGRYRVERELGAGGMATVFLAHDLKHERAVAIKVLLPDLAAYLGAERFHREIRVTAGLQHPHILPLYDSGEEDGLLYYVMPFAEGESLRQVLDRGGRLPLDSALAITTDIAAGLTYAHQHGIVHRDIKPENILLEEGRALVADFGVALAGATPAAERMTATGLAIGTPAYMSPEQISGERALDGRSDVYALACVVYEMLTGRLPFDGPTAQAVLAKRLTEPVAPVSRARDDLPPAADEVFATALASDRARRFPTPAAFAAALTAAVRPAARSRVPLIGMAVMAVLAAAVVIPLWRSRERAHARTLLPRIAALTQSRHYREAYALAAEAGRWLAGDSAFRRLLPEITDTLNVTSDPSGARVRIVGWATEDSVVTSDTIDLGTTPVQRALGRADYHLLITADGHAPIERIASSALPRASVPGRRPGPIEIAVALTPAERVPAGMIAIPGGPYTLAGPGLPFGYSDSLADYFIDRFEVSNADYLRFIRDGGYAATELWGGAPRGALVDRTGLPGPRGWRNQEPPANASPTEPVGEVTWREASAYCASRGKALPSVYQWEKAARNGLTSHVEIMMPWGAMAGGGTAVPRANFASEGAAPVDDFPLGISQFGAYNMAGNVKEWLANPAHERHLAIGGSWRDPSYVYSEVAELEAGYASPAIGFRCARMADTTSTATGGGGGPFVLERRTPTYHPVNRAGFRSLLTHYGYDRRPLAPRVVDTTATADWIRLTVWLDAPRADSIMAYLYLPVHAAPPYQTIVYVPGSNAFFDTYLRDDTETTLGPHIKAGRAVLSVVLSGMRERPLPGGILRVLPSSVQFRDLMVLHATELSVGIDYLATRADIDMRRLVYLGKSLGAGSRLVLAAVERRYAAVVFIGGGIDERLQPTLPEASSINFAPYIDPPTLLVNGHQDEEHRWITRGLPLWNLLSPPKELVLLEGAGHIPPLELRVSPINRWLDSVLGPAR